MRRTMGTTLAPTHVKMVPRLWDDMLALCDLVSPDDPPELWVRPTQSAEGYLFGDASGFGYGTSLWVKGSPKADLTNGNWGSKASENSSNF